MCDRLTSNDRKWERVREKKSQNFATVVAAAVRLVSNWNQSVCLLFVCYFVHHLTTAIRLQIYFSLCVCSFNCTAFNLTEAMLALIRTYTERQTAVVGKRSTFNLCHAAQCWFLLLFLVEKLRKNNIFFLLFCNYFKSVCVSVSVSK